MDSILSFGLTGTGSVAALHLKAFQQLKHAQIVAVCDQDQDRAKETAIQNGVDWNTEYSDFVNRSDIDAIIITTPSGLHADLGIKAAKAGKHVVVEKPIDVSLDKADALIRTCQEQGVTLSVISQYRFLKPILDLQKMISRGELGELIQGDAVIKWYRPQSYYDSGDWRGTWALDGGGPFINQGIHFIDLLLSVMGPARWIVAKTKTMAHQIEVEDLGIALLEFENGALGSIQASTATYPGLPARLEIHGTSGTVIIEGERMAFKQLKGNDPVVNPEGSKGGASSPTDIDVSPFVNQYQNIIESIQTNTSPRVNGPEARRSLELILALYESSKQGKTIHLDSFKPFKEPA
jgi:predicted dehydrogenase